MAVSKKPRNTPRKTVRRSISLPREVDSKIQKLARHQNRSANRVLENLIETGLEAREAEKRRFFELADRLRTTTDQIELENIKNELARMTFGS
jgi:predicted DNA-binding protein